jgi:hypothetical protein
MRKEELTLLSRKLMRGTITEEELERLDQWYGTNGFENVPWHKDTDRNLVKERLYKAIGDQIQDEPKKGGFKTWYRYAAVAVLALSIGSIGYWYTEVTEAQSISSSPLHSFDVPPGGHGAILVLENGEEVELRKEDNKVLLEQNGRQVTNQSGTVSYAVVENGAPKMDNQWNTIVTPRGKEYRLELADGSLVWLNSASKIHFPVVFEKGKREVVLEGEAYFEVAKNEEAPFTVRSGNTSVEVLGTHFNVKAYPDENEVRTTLLEGSVRVDNDGLSRLIVPGEQAITDTNGNLQVKMVDLEGVMAWQRGFFEFENTPLSELVKQFSRWYDVEVVYKDKGKETYYGGRISKDLNLGEIVKLLRINGAQVEINNGTLTIEP